MADKKKPKAPRGATIATAAEAAADSTTPSAGKVPEASSAAGESSASAGPGADAPGTNAPPAKPDVTGAAEGSTLVAASLDLASAVGDLPTMPPEIHATASLVVKSKAPQRRRAGRSFGREETVIPLADLTDAEISAMEGDPVLTTHVRVVSPPR